MTSWSARAPLQALQNLMYNKPVMELREKLEAILTPLEVAIAIPMIEAISRLKKEKNAIILAHYYQMPQIYLGIADVVGDSLGLSQAAQKVDQETIVFCGVHFMAETAKLLNPTRKVLIPDLEAGCSLSDSITPEDVRRLKDKHPGVPVVCYVNTTAAIKAESDICCTSANAAKVVNSLGVEEVIFIPDEYLGQNVAKQTGKKIITHPGRCMVHEQFTPEDIADYRAEFPGIRVVAHPECAHDVVAKADYSGSTAGMITYLKEHPEAKKVMLVTECAMSDNIRTLFPERDFQVPCTICPHMKKITLEKVITSLKEDKYEVRIPDAIAGPARRAVERMMEIGR